MRRCSKKPELSRVKDRRDLPANRRLYFSSLLGPLGIPTYGSSGYDWASAPSIWFDLAAVDTLGSLNDFQSDEQGESASPEWIARYNGLAQTLRPTDTFEILRFDTVFEAPTLGAHGRSWARFERPTGSACLSTSCFRRADPAQFGQSCRFPRRGGTARQRARGCSFEDKREHPAKRQAGGCATRWRRDRSSASVGSTAEILCHYLGGSFERGEALIVAGELRLTAQMQNREGAHLEWIEVNIT